MFRRRWSGLPKEAEFSPDLKGLGYFINENDEIRNIENPDKYFKFFLSRNERVNERQRFGFNIAIENIVHQRLENESLEKLRLPLGAREADRHLNIFASPDLSKKSRLVIIFGEPIQMLGILALRTVNGPGGINKGSLVSLVQELKKQPSSRTDSSAPGIILANAGELYWWPEGGCSFEPMRQQAAPMKTAVHRGRKVAPRVNEIPQNETVGRHVTYMFDKVVPYLIGEGSNVQVDVIGIGGGADAVHEYFNDEKNFNKYETNLHAMVILGGHFGLERLKCDGFKAFLQHRARAYINDSLALDTPVAGSNGNANYAAYGCPVFSSGVRLHTESILVEAKDSILGWLRDVTLTPDYRNDSDEAQIMILQSDRICGGTDAKANVNPPGGTDTSWGKNASGSGLLSEEQWGCLPEEAKPNLHYCDRSALVEEVENIKAWDCYQQTGEFAKPELADDDDC